jgi:hypothetical protein
MADLFARSEPIVVEIYRQVKAAARACGPFVEEEKKTSIHFVRHTAFAGVHAQKSSLLLTIKSSKGVASARIAKQERVSANRWHLDLKLHSPAEVDGELKSWLKAAYALAGPATSK